MMMNVNNTFGDDGKFSNGPSTGTVDNKQFSQLMTEMRSMPSFIEPKRVNTTNNFNMTAVAQQILLPDARGFTPLIYACSNGAYETVSTLLNIIAPHGSWFNASLNFRDPKQGKTPLHFAVENNHNEIAKILIEQGANLNLPDFTGKQALHFAVLSSNVELVEFILQHGGDVNAQDVDGLTPVHYAATSGNVSVLVLLVRFGAFVNTQDHQGETALFYAVREGQVNALKLLLQAGANPALQNEDEETVIELCQELNDQSLLAVFNGAHSNAQQRLQFEIFQTVNTCESGKIQSSEFDGCAMDCDAPSANANFLIPEQRPLSFV